MKTNQIMIRDNELFVQRTKDGYFNANVLAKSNNKVVGDYKKNTKTKEFVDQLKNEGIEKPHISGGTGTWMHPKLFVDFAMWVSVEFKSVVIDYVLDGLIKSRNDAGDYYNEMCAAILSTHVDYYGTKPNPNLYINEARQIREILGLDGKDRNEMTEQELEGVTYLQKKNALLLKKKVGRDSRLKILKLDAEMF